MSLADERLKDYDGVLTAIFAGKTYPLYVLMERLVKIVNKDSKTVPFKFNETQCELYKTICERKILGKHLFFDILKGRQFGITTFIAAMYSIEALYNANMRVGIVADTKEHAGSILNLYNYIYDHLDDDNPHKDKDGQVPPHLSYKPTLKYNKGQSYIQTASGNSSIRVMAADEQTGRSYQFSRLHLSEAAFFDKLKPTLQALLQTISLKNKNSMVFIESTANGINDFHNIYYEHLKSRSLFKPVFLAWYNHNDYETPSDFMPTDLEPWEVEKFDIYLSHFSEKTKIAKATWYHDMYLTQSFGDKDSALQEYPFSIEDAFVNSGNSFFNQTYITHRRAELEGNPNLLFEGRFVVPHHYTSDGTYIEIGACELVKKQGEIIKFYEEPVKGHPYVAVADPNEGGKDNSSIVVMDNHTCKQVAVLYSNNIDNEELAYQLYALGMYYNQALISPENNRGQITLRTIIKSQYPNIYLSKKQDYENREQKYTNKYGHNISIATRGAALEEFQLAFKANPQIISDFDTLVEMATFNTVEHFTRDGTFKGAKVEASAGGKDDIVMAMAGFFIVRSEQSFQTDETRNKYNQISWMTNNRDNKFKGDFIEW